MQIQTDIALSDMDEIQCPNCGFNYNHIGSIKTIPGHDNYEAGWEGRGDLVVIEMSCESGHDWQICLGFHKGYVFLFSRKDETHTNPEEQE